MISWKRTSPGSDLQDEQVHLWRVDLNVPDPKFGSLRGTLSEEEILRSERFRFRNCGADLQWAGERCG